MKIKEEQKGNKKTFILEGRLDGAISPNIEEQMLHSITEGNVHVVIDLEKVNYVSSAGIRVLMLIQKEISKRKGSLLLQSVPKEVEHVLYIAGVLSLFDWNPKV